MKHLFFVCGLTAILMNVAMVAMEMPTNPVSLIIGIGCLGFAMLAANLERGRE